MYSKRTKRKYGKLFRYGYLSGKAVVEAELRFSMDEAEALKSLQEYTHKRIEEIPKGEKIEYQAIIDEWLEKMKKRLLHVIPGGKI